MARRRAKHVSRPGLVLPGSLEAPTIPGGMPPSGSGDDPFGTKAGVDDALAVRMPPVDIEAADPDPRPIGQILVERGLVTSEQLDAALAQQQSLTSEKRLGQLLLGVGLLNQRELAKALAVQTGTSYVDLRRRTPSPEALKVLPEDAARDLEVLPLELEDGFFVIAVADPTMPDLEARLVDEVGRSVLLAAASQDDINLLIDRSYRATGEIDEFVSAFEARIASQQSDQGAPTGEVDENAPIVQVVSRILSQAVRDRASDVHIEPMGSRVRIRERIDGALHEALSLPSSMSQALVSRIKIMANMNIVERRRPQDGQFEFIVDGKELDVRVSTISTVFGEKCVLRVLDKQRALYDLAELGMPSDTGAGYAELIRSP